MAAGGPDLVLSATALVFDVISSVSSGGGNSWATHNVLRPLHIKDKKLM